MQLLPEVGPRPLAGADGVCCCCCCDAGLVRGGGGPGGTACLRVGVCVGRCARAHASMATGCYTGKELRHRMSHAAVLHGQPRIEAQDVTCSSTESTAAQQRPPY
eukprot:1148550-Pelagomonas_calceolata.AAC.2